MSRLIRPPFNPAGPLVALKTVRLEGRTVERGERIPPTIQRDLSSSTLRGLWAQGFFECAESLKAVEAYVKADTAKAFRQMNGPKKPAAKKKGKDEPQAEPPPAAAGEPAAPAAPASGELAPPDDPAAPAAGG